MGKPISTWSWQDWLHCYSRIRARSLFFHLHMSLVYPTLWKTLLQRTELSQGFFTLQKMGDLGLCYAHPSALFLTALRWP